MFGTHDRPLFLVTALVLALTPGVDLLYTVARTLQGGARQGAVAAAGILAGCALHAVAAATGLAAVLAASATAFALIKYAGAAYLLWLAFGMLRRALVHGAAQPLPLPERASVRRVFLQGFLGNALNPKVALFFLALLPQFVAVDASNQALAFLFLGLMFVAVGAVVLAAVVALAAYTRQLSASPIAARMLNGIGGLLFVGLAVRLATAERT
jgi:threonine/homoserine/homoserine lactone efflux protein